MNTYSSLESEGIERRGRRLIDLADLVRVGLIVFQFGLLILVIHKFEIESRALLHLMILAFGGFLVHHFLPLRLRLPFFACLSIAGIALVLGVTNCAWIVALGGILIGIAHLPVVFRLRVGIMLLVMVALIVLRMQWITPPWSAAIWPILGSMFMFRMIIYMYDLHKKAAPTNIWWSLSYFFMLPNVCFPLFPVVDYKTFHRTYFNQKDRFQMYQKGINWMLRGLVHLLLYRLITQNFVISTASIDGAGTAVQYAVMTYLLYLYVSGSFALIVGLLHLFGFNLHDTHHNFLLASSFTDFWRRINIYWKEFMEKIFFRPAYYGLSKRVGPNMAMVLAILYAFAFTWFLHSVQWFWIREEFPVTWQDGFFWSLLAGILIVGAIYESKFGRKRKLSKTKNSIRSDLLLAFRTVGTFTVICLLWSMWNIGSFDELASLLSELVRLTPASSLWILMGLIGLGFIAILFGRSKTERAELGAIAATDEAIAPVWRSTLPVVALCIVFLSIGNWPMKLIEPTLVDAVIRLKDRDSLGKRNAELLQRGYYEDLTAATRYNQKLANLYAGKPANWGDNDVRHWTGSFPSPLLIPSASTEFKGATFSTNRWGMRDKEYEKEAAPGTFRIAILGASNTVGSGVNDGEAYESLVEDLLNAHDTSEHIKRFEILNFATPGYGPLRSLATLQNRVVEFNPDVLISVRASNDTLLIGDLFSGGSSKISEIPYSGVQEILNRAGVEPGMKDFMIEKAVRPYATELIHWIDRQIIAECRKHGIRPIALFLPVPSISPDEVKIGEHVDFLREEGFDVIDMEGVYGDVDQKTLWIARWDNHPNQQGHRMIAEKLYEGLRELILKSNQAIGE